MPLGVRTVAQLDQLVAAYMEFDEFVVDVETMGEHRGDPHRNEVFWIALAGPGRTDVIPCGHPLGERIIRDPDDPFYRIDPASGRHQEHRINESSGRPKWVNVPVPFEDPPEQLWVSDVVQALRPLFFSDRRKIGQNTKFDILSLAKYWGAIPPGPFGDTLIAARLINENHFAYDLGQLVKRAFRYEYAKIGKQVEVYPYSEAHLYSHLDAKYTWLLWCLYWDQLDAQDLLDLFEMEMDLVPVILDMESHGVGVDLDALAVLGKEFSLEMARHMVEIERVYGGPINLNANVQVADLVYNVLGHTCKKYTKTLKPSVARETLEDFRRDKTVKRLLDYAQLNKLQGTFIEGLARNSFEGRVHPKFKQLGAVSGRMSCSEPNIQQIPSRSERGKRVRDVFVAGPGKVLVVADLSQIELRVLAHFTQDEALLRAYRENLDLHSITAERVFGPDFTPQHRSLAKNGNFSVVYGGTPSVLVRRYEFPSRRVAEDVLDGFFQSFPSVKPWKEQVTEQALAHYSKRTKTKPYVETILGRRRRLPELQSTDEYKRGAAQRQAISSVVQGSAADLFKVVMIDCYLRLTAAPWEGHILMTVHDELIVEVPVGEAEEGLGLVKSAMEDVLNPFTGEPFLSVPIVADAKIVTRWSDAK